MFSFALPALFLFLGLAARSTAAEDIATTLTDTHNSFRATHAAPALTWNASMASVAASHVAACVFEQYNGAGSYGQNLAAGNYDPISGVIDDWYSASANYDYSNPVYSINTGTFTQLVWKASMQLGCAVQNCDGQNDTPGTFVLCLYLPAGNQQGKFAENVLKPVNTERAASAVMMNVAAGREGRSKKKMGVAN